MAITSCLQDEPLGVRRASFLGSGALLALALATMASLAVQLVSTGADGAGKPARLYRQGVALFVVISPFSNEGQ